MSEECREHHYGSDGRCRYCQIKASYHLSVMNILNSWDELAKKDPNERWQEKVDSFKCKPHKHSQKY